jgi:hypothetical protein
MTSATLIAPPEQDPPSRRADPRPRYSCPEANRRCPAKHGSRPAFVLARASRPVAS